jgi:hypothetical protein
VNVVIKSLRRGGLKPALALAATAALAMTIGQAALSNPASAADPLISQGKAVSASSEGGSGYVAKNAVDGSTSTRWASISHVDPQWIRVDLGKTYKVSKVTLVWDLSCASSYKIQTSSDGSTFSDKFSTTTGKGGTENITLSSSARYVRMYGQKRCRDMGYSLQEFKVYGSTGTTTSPSPSPSASSNPGGAPTAAQLLAKVTSCSQISNGKYKTDEDSGSATVPVCGKNGAFFYKADMDVDCDGQTTSQCNENTDCCYQNDTAFHQSNGKPLNAAALPYVVIPSESGIFRYSQHGVNGASVVAVIFNNKVEYAVIGDTGPTQIAGEASYATAKGLGINPDPSNGGTDSTVTYIFFEGSSAKVSPIEDHNKAISVGEAAAKKFLSSN